MVPRTVLLAGILVCQPGVTLARAPAAPEQHQAAARPVRSAAALVGHGDAIMQQTREFVPGVRYEDARRAYAAALGLEPGNHEAMVGLAWVGNSEHAFAEGRRWARAALAVNPWSPRAHALLGDAALELGDYDAAFEHYQNALDLQPDMSSYGRAAQLLWITGEPQRARALLQKATSLPAVTAEHLAWCYTQLGLMSWHEGALDDAEQLAGEALRLRPGDPLALVVMARILASRGAIDSAVELYRRSVRIHPSRESLSALGDLMAISGADSQAAALYARAFRPAGDDHGNRQGHGHTHEPGTGDAHLARLLADHDRDPARALREAETAYRASRNIYVADALAWCHYKAGHYGEARRYSREALRFATPDASLHYHAGMISAALGERAEARLHLERALALNDRFDPRQAPLAAQALQGLREVDDPMPVQSARDDGTP